MILVPGANIDPDIAAIAALSGTAGVLCKTAANTWALRTLTMPAAGITGSNLDGAAGNPTLALANDLSAIEALASTGIAARTGSDTWAQRTLQAPVAGFTITNPAGVAGDPTFVLANDLLGLEGLSTNGFAARTGTSTWATREITGTSNQVTVTNGTGVSGDPQILLPGTITFSSGQILNSAGTFQINATGSSGVHQFANNGTNTWSISSTGVLGNSATTHSIAPTTGTSGKGWIEGKSNHLGVSEDAMFMSANYRFTAAASFNTGHAGSAFVAHSRSGNGELDFYTGTTNNAAPTRRWTIQGAGHIVPLANQAYNIGIVTTNAVGSVYAVNLGTSSDERIKKDLSQIQSADGLEKIMALNPVRYRYSDKFDETAEVARRGKLRAGFKAQDLYKVIPEAVLPGDDDPSKNMGDVGYKGWAVDPLHIIPYLVSAIQELNKLVKVNK